MTEIYKTRFGLSPPFMKDTFADRNTGYNLKHDNDSQLPKVQSNKQAHFLFSKAMLNIGVARTATVDFAKYIYHRLGT